jgi:hypothetical protein
MASETMTSKERYEAAISLEKPDRIPITPLFCTPAAISLLGLDTDAVVSGGNKKMIEVEFQAFDEYGGWDAMTPYLAPDAYAVAGLKYKLPSNEMKDIQILEEENMLEEDYDIIVQEGYREWAVNHLIPRTGLDGEALMQKMMEVLGLFEIIKPELEKRAVPLQFTAWNSHPFFGFSMQRSMEKFTEDLYYRPEKVEKAIKAAVPVFIENGLMISELTGCKVICCVEERAGGFFYPPAIFERFWLPYALEIVDAFWSKGLRTWFHLDTSWDKNLPYFKQFPRGSAIVDLDGTTDIFVAKEILNDHLCISTDVSAAVLSIGKPEDVEDYCKKLIDKIAYNGGCLLTSGCTVPGVVKPENFKAMLETGRNYELNKK